MNYFYLKIIELLSYVDSRPKNIYLMTKDNKECLNKYYKQLSKYYYDPDKEIDSVVVSYDPDNEEYFVHTEEELKYLAEH